MRRPATTFRRRSSSRELRQQIQTVSAANIASGGKYAAQLTQLVGEKTALDTKAAQGYSAFHSETESTTAGDGEATDAASGAGGVPGDPAAGAGKDPRQPGMVGGEQMSPEKAGQLASMLPQLIPTLLGAAGGLVGGLMKAPETLMQAGSQMAGQVSQQLGGLMKSGLDADKLDKASRSLDSGLGAGGGHRAGGGGGTCRPAVGRCPPRRRSLRRRGRHRICLRCRAADCRNRFHRLAARHR